MANEQITSLTEKLQQKQIGSLAGAIKSPNFKYSVLGTIFGRKTSRKDWLQLVAGIKNPTPRNSLLGLIFGNNQFKNSTQVGTGQTAFKIKPLEQGNEFIDGLLKIYTFMRKTHDEDVLRREEEANFREEKLLEEKRRHEKLVDSIEKLKKSLMMMAYSAQPQKAAADEGGGPIIVPSPLRGPGRGTKNKPTSTGNKQEPNKRGKKSSTTKVGTGGKTKARVKPTAMRLSRTLRSAKKMVGFLARGIKQLPAKFLGSAGVVAGITNLVMDISNLIDQRENEEIDDKELHKGIVKAIGAATAGTVGAEVGAALGSLVLPFVGTILGGIGGYYFGSKYGEQIGEKLYNYFDRGGSETPPQQSDQEKDLIKSTMGLNQTEKTVVNTPPVASSSKATGASLAPNSAPGMMSQRLSSAIKENNDVKLDTMIQESSSSPSINNVQASVSQRGTAPTRTSMPPVRNLEESFQRSMIYSTRVV